MPGSAGGWVTRLSVAIEVGDDAGREEIEASISAALEWRQALLNRQGRLGGMTQSRDHLVDDLALAKETGERRVGVAVLLRRGRLPKDADLVTPVHELQAALAKARKAAEKAEKDESEARAGGDDEKMTAAATMTSGAWRRRRSLEASLYYRKILNRSRLKRPIVGMSYGEISAELNAENEVRPFDPELRLGEFPLNDDRVRAVLLDRKRCASRRAKRAKAT